MMCQDVAHIFGLDHQSAGGSSPNTGMDYCSNTGANADSTFRAKPDAHGFDELKTICHHLDSTTTKAGPSRPRLRRLSRRRAAQLRAAWLTTTFKCDGRASGP